MKILLFILVFICLQTQKVHVIDENTKEPIESANVIIFKNGKVINSDYTNDKGEFLINNDYDSIKVSILGYADKTIFKSSSENIVIKLTEKDIALNEVLIGSANKLQILGNYKKRSSETRIITKEELFGVIINNIFEKELNIKSIFLNFKKIPSSLDLVINFYEVQKSQNKYTNLNTKEESTLNEILPDFNNKICTLNHRLISINKREIIEINLDSLSFALPSDGVFISVYVKNIYNNDGEIVNNVNYEQFPVLYSHRTEENNYCIKLPYKENYWQNINQVGRYYEDTDEYHPLISMSFYEPSIGISVESKF